MIREQNVINLFHAIMKNADYRLTGYVFEQLSQITTVQQLVDYAVDNLPHNDIPDLCKRCNIEQSWFDKYWDYDLWEDEDDVD